MACNHGPVFPLPEFGTKGFVIPGFRDAAGITGSRGNMEFTAIMQAP